MQKGVELSADLRGGGIWSRTVRPQDQEEGTDTGRDTGR